MRGCLNIRALNNSFVALREYPKLFFRSHATLEVKVSFPRSLHRITRAKFRELCARYERGSLIQNGVASPSRERVIIILPALVFAL